MRVVVLGKGTLAIKAAGWFLGRGELAAVVPVWPEPTWTESLAAWALGRTQIVDHFDELPFNPDLAFSVYYDRILPADFIERCGRVLNLHNAPLPRYRGVNPINWALKNGEREHGVTIHEVTPEIDAGPIVMQAMFPIDPEHDEVIDVYERCLNVGWTLFQETMARLDRITPTPQDDADATYYSREDAPRLGDRSGFRRLTREGAEHRNARDQ